MFFGLRFLALQSVLSTPDFDGLTCSVGRQSLGLRVRSYGVRILLRDQSRPVKYWLFFRVPPPIFFKEERPEIVA